MVLAYKLLHEKIEKLGQKSAFQVANYVIIKHIMFPHSSRFQTF